MAQITVARLTANYGERVRPDRTDLPCFSDEKMDNLRVAFGRRYRSGAIATEADDDLSAVEDPHHPTERPGSRLAHVRFARGAEIISSLDLLGWGFLLLAAPGDGAWMAAAEALQRNLGAPLEGYQVGSHLSDHDGRFLADTGLERGGASLIRPDGLYCMAIARARCGCFCSSQGGSRQSSMHGNGRPAACRLNGAATERIRPSR